MVPVLLEFNSLLLIQKIDIEDKKVKEIAAYVVSHINNKLDTVTPLCSKLSLKRILSAVQVIPNEKVMIYMLGKL